MSARVLRVYHPLYGFGWWQRMAESWQAFVRFDADRADRRVLVKDLRPVTLRESGAHTDRQIADMMGRDPRAVVPALRLVTP